MAQAAKSNGTPSAADKDKTPKVEGPSLDDLYSQIETLKADIAGLATTITEVGQAEAKRALETAKSKRDEVKSAGEDQIAALRAQAETYGRDAGQMISQQPATALGLAAGIGFFFGFLMSNRR